MTINLWTSQLQQVVPNSGQSASFKSASDFNDGAQGLAALAKGLGEFSATVFDNDIRERQTRQEIALLEEIQNRHRRSNEFITNFEAENQGKSGIDARAAYQAFFENEAAEVDKTWAGTGSTAQKYLTLHMGNIGVAGLDRMGKFGQQQKNDWMLSVANGGLGLAFQDAQRDPANYQAYLGPALDTLAVALRKAGQSDEEIAAKRREIQAKWERVQGARGMAEAAELKKQGLEAQKQLIEMSYGLDGRRLTEDEVVARRDLLSPSDYEKYIKGAQEGTSPPAYSNPESVDTLMRMAINDDSDLQDAAYEELQAGRLTVSDYRAAIKEGQQFRDPVIKQALEEIRLKTGYSEMNPYPYAGGSFIDAKKDFLTWLDSDAGKKASDDAKINMASRTANNYRIIDDEKAILSAPAPRFQVGSRLAPDIQKNLEATQAALEVGEITQEEFAEQVVRIKRLADILERQRAAEAADVRRNGGQR